MLGCEGAGFYWGCGRLLCGSGEVFMWVWGGLLVGLEGLWRAVMWGCGGLL